MKPLTHEWIAKAEGDYRTAGREWRVRRDPNYDAVCFHAQQVDASGFVGGFFIGSYAHAHFNRSFKRVV